MTGFMFWQHGMRKFGYLEGRAAEFPDLRWFAGVLEMFGGPLISLGLFTKPLAFLLSGEMAVAYFRVHAPQGFWPILNAGEPAFPFCFIFLLFATTGPGKFGVDGWIAKRFGPRWC
jgi:putative oxidoreductase